MISTTFNVAVLTVQYWMCLFQFVVLKKKYSQCDLFEYDKHVKVHIYSLSLMFKLWSKKHYRSKNFQQDLLDNLKNVAIPGTGIPLSYFCYSKWTVYLFVFVLYPLICLCGSVYQSLLPHLEGTEEEDSIPSALSTPIGGDSEPSSPRMNVYTHHSTRPNTSLGEKIYQNYLYNLLHSDDWFTLWRTNCHLVSYHSYVTKSSEYKMEDKWTFLTQGEEMHVPVTPYLKDIEVLVCKNKLIEGGMGIHFFPNAAMGGNYILQPSFQNAAWLKELLPPNAPLSTMRVITTSTYSLSEEYPLKKSLSLLSATKSLLEVVEQTEQTSLANESSANAGATSCAMGGISSGLATSITEAIANHHSVDTRNIMKTMISEESSLRSRNRELSLTASSDAVAACAALAVSMDGADPNTLATQHPLAQSPSQPQPIQQRNEAGPGEKEQIGKYIRAESAVLRLGRHNAATDHSSVLFDVDLDTGVVGYGTTNRHWYQLGLRALWQQLACFVTGSGNGTGSDGDSGWLPEPQCRNLTSHLDVPNGVVTGKIVPNMQEALEIVTR